MGKADLEQVNKFCIKNHPFPEYQFANRAKYSFETATISVSDYFLWVMEHTKSVGSCHI